MKIDVYTAAGSKKGSVELPKSLFEAAINTGLMHLALMRQQSNRRHPVAHVKTRGEVRGSTHKLFQQKGTGRARRGSVRSPLLKGGGKAFGPRGNANFQKEMPRKMRRAALFSCLSLRAKEGAILGLENYPDDVKTKSLHALLKKMPLPIGRKLIIVISGSHKGLELSARNIPNVKTLRAQYLNPEDVLGAQRLIFLVDAIKKAEETFGGKDGMTQKSQESQKSQTITKAETKTMKTKKTKPSDSSISSQSS